MPVARRIRLTIAVVLTAYAAAAPTLRANEQERRSQEPQIARADSIRRASEPTDARPVAGVYEYYRWFRQTTLVMERLIDSGRGGPTAATAEHLALEWSGLHEALRRMTPPPSLKEAHETLLTACALGERALSESASGRLPLNKPSALAAGASLALDLARHLERYPAGAAPQSTSAEQ